MALKIIKRLWRLVRREFNQTFAYNYEEVSGMWQKYEKNPVVGNEETGSMFDPFVRKLGEKFIMCASKRKNHSLVLLESKDGKKWINEKLILSGNTDGEWDAMVNRGCILKKEDVWYLWFTGQSKGKSAVGLAVSSDGTNFKKIIDKPVLVPETEFEGNAVMNPCVMWDEEISKFRMWYAAGDNYEPDVICYAESLDGIEWDKWSIAPVMTKNTKVYQKCKVGGCDVVKIPTGQYLMAYIAYQNIDVARICLAISDDGITNWIEYPENPVISPSRHGWDSDSVYKPSISIEDEDLMIWYNGRKRNREYIGLAFFRNYKENLKWK
jgi:predicted GH43/DUF377 family glycosyl hydrolase